MAVGGAAYLVSKAVREAEVVAFADLGMEAIYKFVVEDMPVSVAVDVMVLQFMRLHQKSGKRKLVKFQLSMLQLANQEKHRIRCFFMLLYFFKIEKNCNNWFVNLCY
jgi:hypothetical protein